MMPGNPIVGGVVLRRPAIRSPNFLTGSAGWTINADGSAEFNNLSIRGTFNGTNFIINSTGAFFYSGTPALGNLVVSITGQSSSGTDSFGNIYGLSLCTYAQGVDNIITELNSGHIFFSSLSPSTTLVFPADIVLVDSTSTAVSPELFIHSPSGLNNAGYSSITLIGTSKDGTSQLPSILLGISASPVPFSLGPPPPATPRPPHLI